MKPDNALRFRSCVLFLHDGRHVELSGLTVDEAWQRIVALRIAPGDVAHTLVEVHTREQYLAVARARIARWA